MAQSRCFMAQSRCGGSFEISWLIRQSTCVVTREKCGDSFLHVVDIPDVKAYLKLWWLIGYVTARIEEVVLNIK